MNLAKRYSDKFKKSRNLYDKSQQHSMSLTEEVQKLMAIDSEVMSYLRQKDVAPWFRGTSIFHIEGSNKLLNALRDDAEQSTTHRVRSCLNLIGLEPMITSKQIRFLMRLCRGNDLAFLWFLMEMHYKTPKPGTYSINEQLICSAICHLDTITTLRELDKILPHSNMPTVEMAKAGTKYNEFKNYHSHAIKQKRTAKYVLPYFEKNRRPEPYGKPLTVKIPNFKVDFDFYNSYNDPNHIVANETNRWYANYDFNPGRRIAFRIIRETIANIFENFEAESLKANKNYILCDYHKAMKQMEKNLEHELRVKVRDECLKHYFETGAIKEERSKQVKRLLDEAIEEQLCKFRKQVNMMRKEMTLKTITSDCDIYDVMLGTEINECCNVNPEVKTIGDGSSWVDFANCSNNKKQLTKVLISNDVNHTESSFGEKYMLNYDYGHDSETPAPSQTFFHRPKEHEPYKFDYRNIFNVKHKVDNIKKTFLEALDKDKSFFTEFKDAEVDIGNAASECANVIFNNELKNYEKKKKEEWEAAQSTEKQSPLSQYPNFANYNAEDRDLMDQMLFDAFEYLRKNPKFVWAQLPDAHKVPMLREWIAQRYGKEYSPQERASAYRASCKIFRALDKINFDFTMPNAIQMGKNLFVNYNCRNYVNKKSNHIKNKYYDRLDTAFMEYARIFWFAMRAYICSNGPPRKTFFAYMPSRFRDNQHFRLWKSYEYRNYKAAWDVRQRAKRRGYYSNA